MKIGKAYIKITTWIIITMTAGHILFWILSWTFFSIQ